MATTKTIHNVVATAVTTAVPTLTRANLTLVSQSQEGLDRESVYQLTTGDIDYPLQVRVGVYRKPDADNGIGRTNISVAITTMANEVDDTTGEILWEGEVRATLATSIPSVSGVVDVDDYIDLISNLYTMFFDGVDGSNNPNTNVVDKFKYGIPLITA